jgi:hypothetical protein
MDQYLWQSLHRQFCRRELPSAERTLEPARTWSKCRRHSRCGLPVSQSRLSWRKQLEARTLHWARIEISWKQEYLSGQSGFGVLQANKFISLSSKTLY